MNGVKNSTRSLDLLSRILLGDGAAAVRGTPQSPQDIEELRALAHSHHVILRSFPALQQAAVERNDTGLADSIAHELEGQHARIHLALSFLGRICAALGEAGKTIVIKSLDHWPDLGSDLDLFTDADPADVVAIMQRQFNAKLAERSWGDRLASKWNFIVPGLPELVEVHVQRLGQTGEQVALAKSLVTRARMREIEEHTFQVAAPEDRLMISTLQRMYRHFYIRLCDIVDNAQLVDSGAVDYIYLKSLAQSAGLWNGLATYLVIVSDYVKLYRGEGLSLPALVTSAARFGGDQVFFRRNFIRIPLLPHSANLYASELGRLLLNGEIANTLRLSLLPGLATAAAIEMQLTGSDKGIW